MGNKICREPINGISSCNLTVTRRTANGAINKHYDNTVETFIDELNRIEEGLDIINNDMKQETG